MAKKSKKKKPVLVEVEKAVQFKKARLKNIVQKHLNRKYDWKVSRAISSGEELTNADKAFRESVVAEYNRRVEFLENATTLEEVNKIPLTF